MYGLYLHSFGRIKPIVIVNSMSLRVIYCYIESLHGSSSFYSLLFDFSIVRNFFSIILAAFFHSPGNSLFTLRVFYFMNHDAPCVLHIGRRMCALSIEKLKLAEPIDATFDGRGAALPMVGCIIPRFKCFHQYDHYCNKWREPTKVQHR